MKQDIPHGDLSQPGAECAVESPAAAGPLAAVEAYLTDNAALREALASEPQAVLQASPLGKGEHNANFLLTDAATGRRFVLRVCMVPQPFHARQVVYEYEALKALEGSGCVPVALYVVDGPAAPGKGVLVESFCEGSELDFDHLRPGDLACVAEMMADVHAVPVADDCPLHRPADPLEELYAECVARHEVWRGTAFEDARFERWIERFFKATRASIDAAPAPTGVRHIINTETLPSHFLLPATGAGAAPATGEVPRLRGAGTARAAGVSGHPGTFLDWERPIVGEVAQDIAFFVAPSTTFWDSGYLFARSAVGPFVEEYWRAVGGRFGRGDFDARFEAYLRVSVLRSQTWFCKNAARYAPGADGHTTARTFEKWDTYVSDEFNEMLYEECFR